MQLQISGKNLELTAALQGYIQNKIESLGKYNAHIMDGKITVEPDRTNHSEAFKVTARLHLEHKDVYTEETAATAYAAVDIVRSELERQLHDLKAKDEALHRKSAAAARAMKSV